MNLTCSLSNLPIQENDKVVFIPLKEYQMIFNDGVIPTVVHYPTTNFKLLTFPIFGEYNGSFGLKNIIKDKNVEVIENRFGIAVEDFIHLASMMTGIDEEIGELYEDKDFQEYKKMITLLKGLSGMFILEDIYQSFMQCNFDKENHLTLINLYEGKRTTKEKLDKDIIRISQMEKNEDVEFVLDMLSNKISIELIRESRVTQFVLKEVMDYHTEYFYQNELINFAKEIILMEKLYLLFFDTNRMFYPAFNGNSHHDLSELIAFETKILDILKR